MINKVGKCIASVFFTLFVFYEVIVISFGECIMMGHRVYNDALVPYAGTMIILSTLSRVLIYRDKTIGYLILALSIVIEGWALFKDESTWTPWESNPDLRVINPSCDHYTRGPQDF